MKRNSLATLSLYRRHNNDSGYTVVEVLVALAILTVALVPTVQFAAKLATSSLARDLIVAIRLAQSEMEKPVSQGDLLSGETKVALNNKTWRIERHLDFRSGLVEIRIRVFKQQGAKPLVEFRTLRLSED